MKKLASLLIFVAAMAITTSAFAQVSSTPTGWNSAEMTLTLEGYNIDQVEFTVPAVRLELDYGVLSAQQRFWVELPVTNTTKRAIIVNEDPGNPYPTNGNGSNLLTQAQPSANLRIPAGATRVLRWKFAVSDNAAGNPGGHYVQTFGIVAEGVDINPRDQRFGQTARRR